MTARCPDCGARLPAGQSCYESFTAGQLKELDNPAYWAVHHLSVPCWLLQHDRYSRDGWLATYRLLIRFLRDGVPPATVLRQTQPKVASDRRSWSFSKGLKLPGVAEIRWSTTVADVELTTAEGYCAGVRRWAESILADAAAVVAAAGPEAQPAKRVRATKAGSPRRRPRRNDR